MKKCLSLSLVLALSFSLASCAHKTAKENIETKVENAKPTETQELQKEIRQAIADSQSLTPEQKTKLIAIDDQLMVDTKAVKEELAKAKVVLIELISKKDMNQQEYKALKKKIIELSKQRVNLGFDAAQKVRQVLFPKAKNQTDAINATQLNMYNTIYRHHLHDL